MRIFKTSENSLIKGRVLNSKAVLPNGYEDITDLITNPEKLDEVAIEYLTTQIVPATEEIPYVADSWTNGSNTVYDANDIPTILDEDGEAILDPSYVKVDGTDYAPAQPQKYKLVKKNGADAEIAQVQVEKVIRAAIEFGQELLIQFSTENVILGITADGMTKTVRQAMTEIILALQTGSLYDAIDEIDNIPAESKDGKYITDERLQEYKTKIEEYLGV